MIARVRVVAPLLLVAVALGACSTAEPTPIPTATAAPTATATVTPVPTATSVPTATLEPTPEPTATPTPEPPDALFYYTNAVQLLYSGQYEEAIPQFGIVIRILPDFAPAYNARGLAYFNEEDDEKAIEDFTRAIEIDPEYAEAWRNRGALHLTLRNMAQGSSDLRVALSLFEDDGDSQNASEVRRMLGIPGS